MSAPFELRAYEPSHRVDYLRLLGEAWGGGALPGDAFDWWFDGNPAGSLRSVAVRDGAVVGVAGHAFARLTLGAGPSLGQFSVHAVTAPDARGLGIFRSLERRHEELGAERGSVCVLAFASASTRDLFLGPLEWTQIDRRRVWARPLPFGRRGRRTAALGESHAARYAELAPLLGNHVVRDASYLGWRYDASPRDYRSVESERGGFGVVGFSRRRGMRVALLMELVAGGDEAGSLLRAALGEARGAAALLAVPTPLLPRRLLLRHGFLPTTYRLDLMGKGLAQPLDARSEAWTVSLGDTDFF